jgi:hypothetical protein
MDQEQFGGAFDPSHRERGTEDHVVERLLQLLELRLGLGLVAPRRQRLVNALLRTVSVSQRRLGSTVIVFLMILKPSSVEWREMKPLPF